MKPLYCKLNLLKLHGEGKGALKTCELDVHVEHHTFLTTTLDEGQWSAA